MSVKRTDDEESVGLVVDEVSHEFWLKGTGAVPVLDNVSLAVPPGTVASVVGPSGCGKSTLLNIIAGLVAPTRGAVSWEGRPIVPGKNHEMAMAFQRPGLFPWMTVERNVAVGLRARGHSRRAAAAATDEILATVGLSDFKAAYPSQLSGGMAQRVGIARALALKPRLLLLDEPFAAVDALTRLTLQRELKSLLRISAPTAFFVTHDVAEAITIGDLVIVMTARPASVARVVPVVDEDRHRASPSHGAKLAAILEDLGVSDDAESR